MNPLVKECLSSNHNHNQNHGATVAAAYIFILVHLGYDLKQKDKTIQKKIKELTEEKVCVVYENDKDFVGY